MTRRTGGGPSDIWDDIYRTMNQISGAVADVKSRLKVPTHPVYDSDNFPDEAVRGQIVRDINDPAKLWVYGEDDTWHQIGGSGNLPWAIASTIDTDFLSGVNFQTVPFCPPRAIDPGDGRGSSYYLDSGDGTFDSLGGAQNGININRHGAYLAFMSTYEAYTGTSFRTSINELADTSGATSLNVGNFSDNMGFTNAGAGSKASKLVFYIYALSDPVPRNFGVIIFQNSGSTVHYHQSTLVLIRIADPVEGFLP